MAADTKPAKSESIVERLREVAAGIRKQGASAIEPHELEAAADAIAELLAALKSTDATLTAAALRGERAKPTVSELNTVLTTTRAAIAKAER